MGNTGSWQYSDASRYASFLARLFGAPNHGDTRRGGALIWDQQVLRNRKLFGQPVVFSRVMVRDIHEYQAIPQPHWTYLTIVVPVATAAITETDAADLYQIYNGSGYIYQAGRLWVSTNSLERGIVILKFLTDYLSGVTAQSGATPTALSAAVMAIYNTNGSVNVQAVSNAYVGLRANLLDLYRKAITATEPPLAPVLGGGGSTLDLRGFLGGAQGARERFSSSPNSPNGDYITNNPLQLALEQDWDDKFYARPRPWEQGANTLPSPAYASQNVNYSKLEELKARRERREMLTPNRAPKAPAKKKGREHLADRNSDPRFLYGSADDYRNVGSDIMDITRVYGTTDQKTVYPEYANLASFGISGVSRTPLDIVDIKLAEIQAAASPGDFRPPGGGVNAGSGVGAGASSIERFTDAGNAAVLTHVRKSAAGHPDPFLDMYGGN